MESRISTLQKAKKRNIFPSYPKRGQKQNISHELIQKKRSILLKERNAPSSNRSQQKNVKNKRTIN